MTPGEQTREFYRKQGEDRERERIIKLLEPLMQEIEKSNCDCYIVSRPLIALIKGEQNES